MTGTGTHTSLITWSRPVRTSDNVPVYIAILYSLVKWETCSFTKQLPRVLEKLKQDMKSKSEPAERHNITTKDHRLTSGDINLTTHFINTSPCHGKSYLCTPSHKINFIYSSPRQARSCFSTPSQEKHFRTIKTHLEPDRPPCFGAKTTSFHIKTQIKPVLGMDNISKVYIPFIHGKTH